MNVPQGQHDEEPHGGEHGRVLVTDGEPNGCSGNTIANIGTEVEKYKDVVPTYVIGASVEFGCERRVSTGPK